MSHPLPCNCLEIKNRNKLPKSHRDNMLATGRALLFFHEAGRRSAHAAPKIITLEPSPSFKWAKTSPVKIHEHKAVSAILRTLGFGVFFGLFF